MYWLVCFVYAEKNSAVLIRYLVFYGQAFVNYLRPSYAEFVYPVKYVLNISIPVLIWHNSDTSK